jgi:hypothetical protein
MAVEVTIKKVKNITESPSTNQSGLMFASWRAQPRFRGARPSSTAAA